MISKSEGRRAEFENKFCELLKEKGVNFATGIPCGVQKYIIANLSSDLQITHITATRESEAIGIAAGASLAGKKAVVYMQNSGLCDSINDISSLLISYKIPILLLITWRGCPGEDAPQHFVTGKATKRLLKSIGVPYKVLTKKNIKSTISSAFTWMEKKKTPVTILIRREALK